MLTGRTRLRYFKPWFRRYRLVLEVEYEGVDIDPQFFDRRTYIAWRTATVEDLCDPAIKTIWTIVA